MYSPKYAFQHDPTLYTHHIHKEAHILETS